MVEQIIAIAKTARPRQWLKNLAIFAALVFTGQLFNADLFNKTFWGFILLSILVSSVYFINDVADREKDRLHPFKKLRPIAKGDISAPNALFLAAIGILTSLSGARLLSDFFFVALLSYLLLQVIYTFWLKEIVVIDILAIAAGFILRIYAGSFLINAHLSVWFLLCVISVSLFLAAGKRRAELAILTENVAAAHRKTLSLYIPTLLDAYLAMFATASWVSWSLFTFFFEEGRDFYISRAVSPSLLDELPLTILGSGKLLMLTIPVVIFGVMRYLRLVYEGSRAETPERVLTTDKPLLTALLLWGAIVVSVIYFVPQTL
ncbi:MAG: UbiA prenyltransferase family protein [Candidatus Blackburnbacteria bacterium]|nr:UbiA prenyltransferase family protein [Candidatus Blackburnbacteria bacterium]